MTLGRMLALLLLAGAALATSALFAAHLPHDLTTADPPSARRSPAPTHREPTYPRPTGPRPEPRVQASAPSARRSELGPRIAGLELGLLMALEATGGTLGLATAAVALGVRRTRARRRRDYARYPLHLSPHDEAKPQDVEALMEAIAHLVRAFPADRARHGQPYIAFELDHGTGPSGALEWSLAVRCQPRLAVALDGALSATYPDARLGRLGGEPPTPLPARAAIPGHVMR